MKPTQQEIIEQLGAAFDRAVEICGREFVAKSLLERFGAGGGEPIGHVKVISTPFGKKLKPVLTKGVPEGASLYTHPSPADLRAEYLRGLQDAATLCDAAGVEPTSRYPSSQAKQLADAIRALKGKQ